MNLSAHDLTRIACSVAVQVEGLRGALKDVEATEFQRCRTWPHGRHLLAPIVHAISKGPVEKTRCQPRCREQRLQRGRSKAKIRVSPRQSQAPRSPGMS